VTFRCAASRLFFLFLPPAAAGRPGGRPGAGPLEFGAGLPPRQYSCAGTGRAPPARRRPEATASALAAAFAW
jgi:hypothetical protein